MKKQKQKQKTTQNLILIQSMVSKQGSDQVSESVIPHRIFQLETFLPNF